MKSLPGAQESSGAADPPLCSQRGAPQLVTLPREILCEIMAHLCAHCQNACARRQMSRPGSPRPDMAHDKELVARRNALASLCRMSRLLFLLAQPYLYHCAYLEEKSSTKRLLSLAWTLTSR